MSDDVPAAMRQMVECDKCGEQYGIGDYPYCPHGKPLEYYPFVPRFEWSSGEYVTSLAQRWRIMKQKKLDHKAVGVGNPRCEF